jgi:hypothetical protein
LEISELTRCGAGGEKPDTHPMPSPTQDLLANQDNWLAKYAFLPSVQDFPGSLNSTRKLHLVHANKLSNFDFVGLAFYELLFLLFMFKGVGCIRYAL